MLSLARPYNNTILLVRFKENNKINVVRLEAINLCNYAVPPVAVIKKFYFYCGIRVVLSDTLKAIITISHTTTINIQHPRKWMVKVGKRFFYESKFYRLLKEFFFSFLIILLLYTNTHTPFFLYDIIIIIKIIFFHLQLPSQ